MTGAGRELLACTALAAGLVMAALLAGQLVHVGDLLLVAGPEAPRALGLGALVLLEAVLPLAGLLGAGLAYGRLRVEGVLVARAALGISPARNLAPALASGLLLGLAAALLARGPTPEAVAGLRGILARAGAAALLSPERPRTLPGGGVVRVLAAGEVWAALPGTGAPALVRAAGARVEPAGAGRELTLVLDDAWLWSEGLRVRAGVTTVRLDDAALARRLGMLGPPNDTPSASLDPRDRHARFVWHRRLALPAAGPLWALAGALLGGAFGGALATLAGAGLVVGTYWVLRAGELAARAGALEPAVAAWLPVLMLAALLALAAGPLARRVA